MLDRDNRRESQREFVPDNIDQNKDLPAWYERGLNAKKKEVDPRFQGDAWDKHVAAVALGHERMAAVKKNLFGK